MNKEKLESLAKQLKEGSIETEDFVEAISGLDTLHDEGIQIDRHRSVRKGFHEVVFCEGKTIDHLVRIATMMREHGHPFFGTRCSAEQFAALEEKVPGLIYDRLGRIVHDHAAITPIYEGYVAVVAAGTSDMPVAREAALTAELLGCEVVSVSDVGVAGIHRLLAKSQVLREAKVVIAVAGMEGALPSVLGGITDAPVIAVPTSVGYGASFGGISALLTMLNSCASGVTVVNIDNGFGAGYAAATMIRKIGTKR